MANFSHHHLCTSTTQLENLTNVKRGASGCLRGALAFAHPHVLVGRPSENLNSLSLIQPEGGRRRQFATSIVVSQHEPLIYQLDIKVTG